MKRIISVAVLMIMSLPCYATDENVVSSKSYVDARIDTKQLEIPAAGMNGAPLGDKIITYTGTGGTIGERGIYSDSSSYDASTDADKIITASALNGAISSLPTTDTTKLTCANPGTCDLWAISTQTAYGAAASGGDDPVIIEMLTALVNINGTGSSCIKSLSNGIVGGTGCQDQIINYGDWATKFTYNGGTVVVSGSSACSSLAGTARGDIASDQAAVQRDYESNLASAPTTSPAGRYCYCKLTDPSISGARWVFYRGYDDASACAGNCHSGCGSAVRSYAEFRRAVFGLD